jgi:hypothetical protein
MQKGIDPLFLFRASHTYINYFAIFVFALSSPEEYAST